MHLGAAAPQRGDLGVSTIAGLPLGDGQALHFIHFAQTWSGETGIAVSLAMGCTRNRKVHSQHMVARGAAAIYQGFVLLRRVLCSENNPPLASN